MKKAIIFIIIILIFSSSQTNAQDWRNFYENTNFEKYREANEQLNPIDANEKRVVFMGNSITEGWPVLRPQFFENSNYIGRGISGQTTPQMLLRFRKDVIDLQPKVVVILAGINDIAQNSGFTPIEIIAENIMSMAELANHHGIKVIICSVIPALDFPWSPGLEPANKVVELNTRLKKYTAQNNFIYVDYHSAMKNDSNGLKVPEYTSANDLIHPNEAGYIAMEKLVQPAIDQALAASLFSVNALFSDHMVLQQKEEVTIWGKAIPGQQVSVMGTWKAESKTITDDMGNWSLTINTPKAGGPYQIIVSAADDVILIKDVMIGEVWLASGQSNMSMPLKGWPPNDPIANSDEEIANANYPGIRMFKVPLKYSIKEENSLSGDWEVCSSQTADNFSASAYFFARRLHQELKIPIGIIHSSWGGTPAESWTSKSRLKTLEDFNEVITKIEDPDRERLTNKWYSQFEKRAVPAQAKDWDTIELGDLSMAQPACGDQNWTSITLPGRIDLNNDQDLNGAFWFRKTIELEDVTTAYTFEMGPVDDTDAVFFNGQKIGGTVNKWGDNRAYSVPLSILKKGENTIAIRIIDTGGPGSIKGDMKLSNGKDKDISLEGQWKYCCTAEIYDNELYLFDIDKVKLSERPNILLASPWTPSTLYNAMIHPLLPFNIKGAIWYQGESNVGRAEQYQRLFPAMIKNWRTQWKSNFPFYFVQIAPFNYQNSFIPTADISQKLRDAQRQSLSLDKTGMVVTLDIGNYKNIHPANKQEVGARLAGLALANDYGKQIVASGPLYKSHEIKKSKLILDFNFKGAGLASKEMNLSGFEIAGADKKFVPATAEIIENKVYLSANKITKPMYARYAWTDEGLGSLINKEGLPASSFTTEN